MRRRSREGGEPAKTRRRKTVTPKRRNAPKSASGRSSSVAGQETEVARLTRELNEAREQQTATSEVLQAISSFAVELDPVFQAIVTNATRLCEAKYANLYLFANGTFQLVSAALALERLRGPPIQPTPGTGLGSMIKAKATIQIADVLTDQEYPRNDPLWTMSEREGVRTLLCVPMIKESELIGAVSIFRKEVRPFSDKQIALVKISPPRRLSPSRMRGCSTSCTSAPTTLYQISGAADRDVRGSRRHQPIQVRTATNPAKCRGHRDAALSRRASRTLPNGGRSLPLRGGLQY